MGEADMEQQDEDAIRAKAYELWLRDGQPHGRDLHHWHSARQQLLAEQNGEDMPMTEPVLTEPGAAEPGPAAPGATKAAAAPKKAAA